MPRTSRPNETAADVLRQLAGKVEHEIHDHTKYNRRGGDEHNRRRAAVRAIAEAAGLSEETVRRFVEQARGTPHAVHFETAFRLAQVMHCDIYLVPRKLP